MIGRCSLKIRRASEFSMMSVWPWLVAVIHGLGKYTSFCLVMLTAIT